MGALEASTLSYSKHNTACTRRQFEQPATESVVSLKELAPRITIMMPLHQWLPLAAELAAIGKVCTFYQPVHPPGAVHEEDRGE